MSVEPYPVLACAPLMAQTVHTLSHLAVSHLARGRRHALALLLGGGAGAAACVLASGWALAALGWPWLDDAVALGFNLLAYVALALGYWTVVNLNVTSIRVRIVHELARAGGALPRERLEAIYSAERLAETRVDRLLRYGQLVEQGDRLVVRSRALLALALCVEAVKWIVLGHGSRLLARPPDA